MMHALIVVIYLIAAVFILVSVALISGKLLQSETGNMAVYKSMGLSTERLRLSISFRFLAVATAGTVAGLLLSAGEPPAEVINGGSINAENNSVQTGNSTNVEETDKGDVSGDEILADAISVRIGRDGTTEWNVDMYNNAAALTMLDYLFGSALLFPTYTYDEEGGFVAQSVRGNYTRNDETTIADVGTGELYLFSGGQLRFYFKDIEGANITATSIGCYTDTEGLTEAVQEAYTSNLDDTWRVDVYFWITKTLE